MKTLQTILISLISLTLYSQNEPFLINFNHDTVVVNRTDTVFTFNTDNGKYKYDNKAIHIIRNDGQTTTSFSVIINGFRNDSQSKFPIAEMVTHGRQTTIDNENEKVIVEGSFVNGKQVGIWHNRADKYDIISFFDSTGIELPLVKYKIDTADLLIYISEIDTSTFDYKMTKTIDLIVNPYNYFTTESEYMDSEDTARFCILNLHMDTLAYKSWKTKDLNFIRFVWFRDKNPISLNIVANDSELSYNLIVTDAEFDFDLGNALQKDSIVKTDTKDLQIIKNELDKMDFWNQISKDDCYGDYLFIEVKIDNKYNSKRINCMEYRLPENKKIMKQFEKLAKKAGLENDYKIEY